MLGKKESIASLERLARRIPALKAKPGVSTPEFEQWRREAESTIRTIFPERPNAGVDFTEGIMRAVSNSSNMYHGPGDERFWKAMDNARAMLEAMREDIQDASEVALQEAPTVMAPKGQKRFQIALSFPGEHRPFVKSVAEFLAKRIGPAAVFYDNFYEAELARPDLDTYLQKLYNEDSELIAVFLCAEYEKKEWCGLEWRAIRELIKRKQGSAIMPFRFDHTQIPGLFSLDGYVPVNGRAPETIGELILQRLSLKPTGSLSAQAISSGPALGTGHGHSHSGSEEIVTSPPPLDTIRDSGRLVMLGTHVFSSESVKTHSGGKITIRLAPASTEEDAAIKALVPGTFNRSEAIGLSYSNDSSIVRVKRGESESTGTSKLWVLELEPENIAQGGGFGYDIATQGFSADDIAKMRAGRILLNDPPPIPRNSGLEIENSVNRAMLDTLVAGINPACQVKECPMIHLFSRLSHDPVLFMRVARLQAIFLLRASDAVEHVLDLTLGPITDGKMHVRFKGKRRKAYSNKDATIIELEGDCPLQ